MTAIGTDRKAVGIIAALALLTGILETTLMYVIAFIAVAIANGKDSITVVGPGALPQLSTSFGRAVVLGGGLLLAAAAIQVPLSHRMAALSAEVIQRMRTAIVTSYLAASSEYRSTHKESYLAQLVGEYCGSAEAAVQQLILVLVSVSTLSIFVVAAIVVSPLLAVGAILLMFCTAMLLRPLASRARANASRQATSNREVVRRIAQATRLSDEITGFDVSSRVIEDLSHDVRRAGESLRHLRYDARLVPALSQYSLVGTVLVVLGALSVVSPSALRDVAPLMLLLVRAITYVRQLTTASRAGIELVPYLDLLQAEMEALESNQAYRGTKSPRRFDGFDLLGVGFEYKAGHPVLADVNLSVRPGEMVGLVGRSGSGKSTLSKLIVGLRRPTAGRITTGGFDLADISPTAWSRTSAYVPQDTNLILATVADNIRFFRTGFDSAAIEAAARAAHIHDELEALPQGYETLVGPGARDLSGGQRQRLAIARALLSEPQLIVLDEPMSALDARSEQLVSKTLEELKGTTTILLIAHRPGALAACDRVFSVNAGSVMETDPMRASL